MKPDFVEPISPAPMILVVVDRDRRRVGLVVIRIIGREVADCMVWELSFMVDRTRMLILSCLSITPRTTMYLESVSSIGIANNGIILERLIAE